MSGADGNISVKFSSMAEGEAALQAVTSKLKARLDRLDQELSPLVASWSGEARDAYLVDKTKWDGAAKDLVAMLGQLTQGVGDAHNAYKHADKTAYQH